MSDLNSIETIFDLNFSFFKNVRFDNTEFVSVVTTL